MKTLKHIRAILLLPVMVTIVIPGIITWLTGATSIGWSLSPSWDLLPPVLGSFAIGLGLLFMVKTVALFATVGKGTLAPWDPTGKLVVQGIYRHVRNPMIASVFCVLLGEAILLGSIPLLGWFLLFFLLNLIYIPLVEEPGLMRRFGEDYLLYKKNVPRWIPRLRPWKSHGTAIGERTLCFLLRGDQVLLGLKKAGFGAGKYTGFGGKIEAGETIEAAAIRELQEEIGIRVHHENLQRAAHLSFLFPANPAWSQQVHVFLTTTWEGNPVESGEIEPAWFAVDEIPYEQMWQDAAHWLPRILAGERIRATFAFKEDNEAIDELVID